jgi:pyridinium-3,5-bisthiocarboxylic acid mononucleotide nickel chelatase
MGKLPVIAPLARGAGQGCTLFLDPVAGIAGDMTIGALVDLGVPPRIVEEAVAALGLGGYALVFGSRVHHGIVAGAFDVRVEGDQPHRTYRDVRAILDRSPLARGVRDRAERIFAKLAVAESRVHRAPLDDVHFHEVGAVDALADIVGTAAALDYLGVERVLVAPLPIGRGFVRAAHGRVPLPAPATAELLRGFPVVPVDFEGELVTPTGAAIVAALAKPVPTFPRCTLERTAFGAGTKTWPDRPNVLRVALVREAATASEEHLKLLETNLDDANPEWVAHAVDRLLLAGARDAWLTPITMKKGRAAVTLSVLAPASLAQALGDLVLRETTAIGFRTSNVDRTELARTVVEVETAYGTVPLKVVSIGGTPRAKPESDDCRRLADVHGVPVRDVSEAALEAFAKRAPTP